MNPLFLDGKQAWMEVKEKSQIMNYVEKLFNGNRVEALHIAMNTYENYTQCHCDQQNDEIGTYGTVLSISKTDKLSWKVIIFYSRKCICESVTRSGNTAVYLKDWINFLNGIENKQK